MSAAMTPDQRAVLRYFQGVTDTWADRPPGEVSAKAAGALVRRGLLANRVPARPGSPVRYQITEAGLDALAGR